MTYRIYQEQVVVSSRWLEVEVTDADNALKQLSNQDGGSGTVWVQSQSSQKNVRVEPKLTQIVTG